METKIKAFLQAAYDTYQGGRPEPSKALAKSLGTLCREIEDIELSPANLAPRQEPVCQYLDSLLTLAESGPGKDFAAAIRTLLPDLHWLYRYDVADFLPAFSENWAHAEIIGPKGMAYSDSFRIGLILQGPNTFYPDHQHPAVEVYYVLAGTADWQQGSGPLVPQAPGSLILHPSGVPHVMRTGDEPILAVFAWHGEVFESADWCPGALEAAAKSAEG